MTYSILLMLVWFAATILAPMTLPYAKRLSLMDISNHRSSHDGITPRGGGIVFIIVFYIGILFYCILKGMPDLSALMILFCGIIMAIVGWLDDFADLSVRIRFGIQFLVVLISCLFLSRIWPIIPVVLEKTVIILAWMWFINLFNFMDGTDGYATQEAFFICIGLFILGVSFGNIVLILGFSVLGFLRVNYPKANIFMGDVGSIFLGYIFGGFLIFSIAEHSISIVQAVILTSLFSVDATYTLLKRGLQKKKVWKAHREHWYQRLNVTGANHKTIFYLGVLYNLIVLSVIYLEKIGIITTFIQVGVCAILLIALAVYIKRSEMIYANKH